MAPAVSQIPSRLVRMALRGYSRWISPLLGNNCRFYPTCSAYAEASVARFGVMKGGWLTLRRLLCCHPWHPGGENPVPHQWTWFK